MDYCLGCPLYFMTEKALNNSTAEETLPATPGITLQEEAVLKTMMEAGIFYGLSRSKTNPKVKPYLSTTKSGVEIINLLETLKSLNEAAAVLKEKVSHGTLPLIVGTTPAVKAIVKEMAHRLNLPYTTERWLGGTLTNFKTILARVNYMKKLEGDKLTGKLEKYTKKERLNIEREMAKLNRLFSGLELMEKLPGVVVIFDLKNHEVVAAETKRMKIPTIAVSNTNGDPDIVDHPIISNDKNPESIRFIAEYLSKAIEDGREEALKIAKANEAKNEIKTETK